MSDKRTGKKKKKIRAPVSTEAPVLGQQAPGSFPKQNKSPVKK